MGFCFDPSVVSANPQTAHTGHEKTNLARLAISATNTTMRSLLARSGSPNYGPRRNFVIDDKILYLRKFLDLVEYNMRRNNHIT